MDAELKNYWDHSSENYNHIIHDELKSFRTKAWQNIILKNAPQKVKMDVLDVGTGPGFFAVILSKKGHRVTAIDASPEMLHKAKINAEQYRVDVQFHLVEGSELAFEDSSFDLIVSRNVTWALTEPIMAYKEWLRILRPGGRVLIFDANWHHHRFDSQLAEEMRWREQQCIEIYGSTFSDDTGHRQMNVEYLPLTRVMRPEWDKNILNILEYVNISTEENIIENLWDDKEKLLYGATPLFMIKAEKMGEKAVSEG